MPDYRRWNVQTPALVYDEAYILRQARLLDRLRDGVGLRALFSIKSFPFLPVLQLLAPWLDGFSVSSLYEARLADSVLRGRGHITTPGLREGELAEISDLCRCVAFNSLSQYERLFRHVSPPAMVGIRINPGESWVRDPRYDPCREYSKLGVPVGELQQAFERDPSLRERLEGLHVHGNFGSRSFAPLLASLARLEPQLQPVFHRIKWINLGGGYIFDGPGDLDDLGELVARLRATYDLEVFFEPGNAFIGAAGYLVSTVIDAFLRDGKQLAVLDSSVNHHPEIFEYQRNAEIVGQESGGQVVVLAGSTCLAGDLFGEYRFSGLLRPGDRVAFRNVGAYSMIKASRFNGYPLPSIYAWDGMGDPRLVKTDRYRVYLSQWSADASQGVVDG